jgi:hypothetical protein
LSFGVGNATLTVAAAQTAPAPGALVLLGSGGLSLLAVALTRRLATASRQGTL